MKTEEIRDSWIKEEEILIVIYDNDEVPSDLYNLNLESAWGFSSAIKLKSKKILFDCGWSGNIEIENLKRLNIPLNEFDYVIISHQHWDHMGGLEWIIKENPNATYYLPSDFSNNLTKEIKNRVKKVYRISNLEGPLELFNGFYITGDIIGRGPIGEQAAIVQGKRMNLMITGCLHPGLKLLYEIAKKKIAPNAIIGGMHGFKDIQYLRSTNIEKLFIGHCTQNKNLLFNLKDFQVQQIYPGYKITL